MTFFPPKSLIATFCVVLLLSTPADAGPFRRLLQQRDSESSSSAAEGEKTINYDGRDMLVFVPSQLPPAGSRALVIVLHGGGGNATRIVTQQSEKGLKMDAEAEKDGFIVAYLNGTSVTRFLGSDVKGWNAGNCCGQSAANNIDDVGYITGAVASLVSTYGIDPKRVYGTGHSNGAMMVLRMMCETDVLAAGMPFSGTLGIESSCSHAHGKAIMAVRGANDENVPYKGGKGIGPSKGVEFKSQEYTQSVFDSAGAKYSLTVLPNAAHKFEELEAAVEKGYSETVPEMAARFFGLAK